MSIAETIIQNAQFLERERDHWRERAEAAEESLERDRDDWNRMIDGKNVHIAELERELAESKSQPDLAAVLEELEADKIVLKVWNTGKGGIGASLSPNQKLLIARKTFDFCAVNMEAMIAAIVKEVCESFPDSAFARRRRDKAEPVETKPAVEPTPIELIAAERERQKTGEGWTERHDDTHTHGELALAAACYASPKKLIAYETEYGDGAPVDPMDAWPFDSDFDKREKHPRERQLVIAGALIVAELERLARKRREKNKSVKVKENEHWNPFAEAVKRHRTPWSVKHDGEGAYYMIDADGKHILDGQYDEVIPLEGIVAAVNAYQPAPSKETSAPETVDLAAILDEMCNDGFKWSIHFRGDFFDAKLPNMMFGIQQCDFRRLVGHMIDWILTHHPESEFAQRRKPQPTPEPTPNCSESPNSSPAQPTPEPKAAELMDAVEEFFRKYPDWFHVTDGGIVRGGRARPDVCYGGTDAHTIANILNCYRAIAKAVNKYCDMYNNRDYLSRDFAREVCSIVSPLAKEAGR